MASPSHQGKSLEHAAEVAEFILGSQSFGINGSKIKQLVPLEGVTISKPPLDHPAVLGVFVFRGKTVPLIALNSYLHLPPSESSPRQVVVVTEFNEMTSAFIADGVSRIHRKAWSDFHPLSSYLATQAPQVLGTITIEGREILVLDLEQIVGEIFPASIMNYDEKSLAQRPHHHCRDEAVIFFAEDSFIIRTQLVKVLRAAGYNHVRSFDNGKAALVAIQQVTSQAAGGSEPQEPQPTLLISDIEMPQMDGLVLCQNVKQEMKLPLPVIMFSSLINDQIAKKCRAVGADAWVSKPQTQKLLELVDGFCLSETAPAT